MNKKAKSIILIITLFLIFPVILFAADKGTIKGVVVDAQTNEPLPGANVVIKANSLGAASDINGEFILNNVPVGTNTVTVIYLGYQQQDIIVEIVANETKTVTIKLEALSIMGEEVTVTAQATGQRSAINQQLSSNVVTNVVSSEKMEELPDANAAEAIGRLPGISLKRNSGEANKIVIRGLSPKYNNVTIEGIKMASTNDYDRSVDLSLVQSESLSGIEVSKSLRADMDADALGGTVNLRMREAPQRRKFNLNIEGGYANLNNDFANYKVSGGASDRFFNKKVGVNFKASYELKQLPSHRFNGGYSSAFWNFDTDDSGAIIDSSLLVRTNSATLVDQQQTRRRTNGSLILDYKNDWWDVKFINIFSQKNDDVVSRSNQYLFVTGGSPQNFALSVNETGWKTRTRIHTLQNTFRFGISKLDLNLSTSYAQRTQEDQNFPFIESNNFGLSQNELVYRQPESIMQQIGGPDSLKIEDTKLQVFNLGDMELIDQSYDLKLDYEISFTLGNSISGKLQVGGKYHQLTRSSDGTSRYSNFQWGGGVANRQTLLSTFPWITTDLNSQRGINAENFVDNSYNPGEFLNGRYDLGWSADIDLLTDMQDEYYEGPTDGKYFERGVESYVRDYEATEKLSAGYIMTELNIGQKLMLLPGIRYEKNKTEYFAYHIRANSGMTGIEPNPDSLTTNRTNARWFPSINIKYKPTDFFTVQGAIYKSTSRPSFRQISPLVIYPSSGNNITSNNPYLEPSEAINYDLGFSIKKDKIGLFTVYGFYKEISDLIFTMSGYKPNKKGSIIGGPEDIDERLLGAEYYDEFYLKKDAQTNLPFNNSEKAYIKGIEISWQTNFWYLPGLLKGLVLDVNYTMLDTKTKYPYFKSVVTGYDESGFFPVPIYAQQYETREGPMQDQPESILNIILGWDYKDFSGRVSYRYQSKTVEGLDSRYSVFDRYYDTFSLVDVMLKQKITKNISCYANLTNIGKHVDEYYFGAQGEHPALPTGSQSYGFRAQLGVKINL